MAPRRAKVVCTLGPAVDDPARIEALVAAGMDVARLNYSHGSHEEHARRAAWVRAAADRAGRHVALLQDLCGPKIRAGVGGPSLAVAGSRLTLVQGQRAPEGMMAVGYDGLAEDLHPGDRVLLGDGEVELEVASIEGERVHTTVTAGGPLRERMGVNLPSGRVRQVAFGPKDEADLEHGLALGVDWVALSFVRRAQELAGLRDHLERRGATASLCVKIETREAVETLDELLPLADSAMVARGDLGLELPPERVPVLQKRVLAACRAHRRPCIVATEMLDSMVTRPRPTRAEASDVANAVFDGADAVMLSAETANGRHPVEACRMMDRLIRDAEASPYHAPPGAPDGRSVEEAVAGGAGRLATSVGARAIVALTKSGQSARLVAATRPRVPVLALSPEPGTLRRLALVWGVVSGHLTVFDDVEHLMAAVRQELSARGWVAPGDRFVVVYGMPLGIGGATNALRVEAMP